MPGHSSLKTMQEPIDFNLALIERQDRFSFWHDFGPRIH
jgi:hypothetical protein